MNSNVNTFTYTDLVLGQVESFDMEITPDLIEKFADISGDHSPLHVDDTYAQTTQFGERIGHGMLSGMWFSRLVGMLLPGKYAVYLSQTLNFHKPFTIGLHVIVHGEIIQKIDSVQAIKIKTTVMGKKNNDILVSGEALVKVLS